MHEGEEEENDELAKVDDSFIFERMGDWITEYETLFTVADDDGKVDESNRVVSKSAFTPLLNASMMCLFLVIGAIVNQIPRVTWILGKDDKKKEEHTWSVDLSVYHFSTR